MYNELEKYYKRNSNQIKARKTATIIYATLVIIILVINSLTPGEWFLKTALSLLLVLSATIITALFTRRTIKQNGSNTLKSNRTAHNYDNRNNDLALIKKYLKKHELLSEKALYEIKNHYLVKSTETKPNHTLEVFLTIATIASSLLSGSEPDTDNITKSTIITIIIIIVIFTIYFIIKSYYGYYRFFTGDDDLYETLEDVTTRLYLETVQKDRKK